MRISVSIVDFGQSREMKYVRDESGTIQDMIPDTKKSFISIELPSRKIIRAEVSNSDYEAHISRLLDTK